MLEQTSGRVVAFMSYLGASWEHLAHHCWKLVAGLDGDPALSSKTVMLQFEIIFLPVAEMLQFQLAH